MECTLFIGATSNDTAVVTVVGEIDAASAARLRERVFKGLSHREHLVIDMAGVTFMDSAALSVIVDAARNVQEPVVLRSAPEIVRTLIDRHGLQSIVTLVHPPQQVPLVISAPIERVDAGEAKNAASG